MLLLSPVVFRSRDAEQFGREIFASSRFGRFLVRAGCVAGLLALGLLRIRSQVDACLGTPYGTGSALPSVRNCWNSSQGQALRAPALKISTNRSMILLTRSILWTPRCPAPVASHDDGPTLGLYSRTPDTGGCTMIDNRVEIRRR
jgi:hypothetical protein